MPNLPFDYSHNGSIIYQFGLQEIISRDLEPFLQQFDYRRHKNLAVAQRHVGCLSLAFSLPAHPEAGQRLVHPAEFEEFRIFAEILLDAFPALGLLIDTKMDHGFPNLVYASMDEIRFHVSKESVLFIEPDALRNATNQITGEALKLAEKVGVDPHHARAIRGNVADHLKRPIKIKG